MLNRHPNLSNIVSVADADITIFYCFWLFECDTVLKVSNMLEGFWRDQTIQIEEVLIVMNSKQSTSVNTAIGI